MTYFTYALLLWNVIVFFVYGADKLKAKKSKRRISEATLITLAFLFGGVGGLFGMVMFNHKTSKMKFRLLVPLAAVLTPALLQALSIWIKAIL